jgi:hypothetical protein
MLGTACFRREGVFHPIRMSLALLLLASVVGAQQPSPPPRNSAGRPRAQRVLHQSPPGCSQNALTIDIARNPPDPIIVNGTVVTYTVRAFNVPIGGGLPCDATAVSVSFTCPGPDGNPTGATTVLASNDSLPSGSFTSYPPVMCTVTVNLGVTKATAQGSFSGTIHTTDPDDIASGTKTITVNIIPPTPTQTPTNTSTPTVTPTFTNSFTNTPTFTATNTFTQTNTPTFTNTPTITLTGTPAPPTSTPTITPTATTTLTPLPPTATPNFTSTATPLPATATQTPTSGPGPPGGAIPTLSPSILLLLAFALGAAALVALRRQ